MALKELSGVYEKGVKNQNKKVKGLLGSDFANFLVNIGSKYGQKRLS